MKPMSDAGRAILSNAMSSGAIMKETEAAIEQHLLYGVVPPVLFNRPRLSDEQISALRQQWLAILSRTKTGGGG